MTSIDNLLSQKFSRQIFYHSAVFTTGSVAVQNLYFTEQGYQRKGMDGAFYEEFENCRLYFDKADVLRAYDHVRDDEILKTHFKQNFIDNFTQGISIFYGSW